MNKKRVLAGILAAAMCMFAFTGCKNKEEPEETVTEELTATITDSSLIEVDQKDIVKDGKIFCYTNGQWIDEEYKDKRCIAVSINNLEPAIPQSGVGSADIIYEMLAEGGVTRLLAVFNPSEFPTLTKIGPVRSARQYFDRTALEYDAVFFHAGKSAAADEDFAGIPEVQHIDGLSASRGFFRSDDRVAPHNFYLNGEECYALMDQVPYQHEVHDYYETKFKWNDSDTDIEGGKDCKKITTAFNSGRKPYFEYDAEKGEYLRYQYGAPQPDKETGEQLAFENVIIQQLSVYPHPKWPDVLIEMDLQGDGTGYYATNGKIVPITWHKDSGSWTNVTRYYLEDGTELKLNPGKTWITYFPKDVDGIIIE